MLAGWWLVFCLVVSTGYKSSLVAHLTVQAKSLIPKDFDDLVKFNNWGWGTEQWMLDGELLNFYKKNPELVVQEVYRGMEVSQN